jgi:hypothetical protein
MRSHPSLQTMSYLGRIAAWKTAIGQASAGGIGKVDLDELESLHSNLFTPGGDIGGDVEISFRELLADQLEAEATRSVSRSRLACSTNLLQPCHRLTDIG